MEVEIYYSVSDNIDVLLMTSGQYVSWQNGNTVHIESGSDYDDDSDDYVFTIVNTDSYYLLFDNSNSIGTATDSGTTVTGTADISIVNPSNQQLRTRAWVEINSYAELDFGSVQSGKVISTSVSCDIGLTSSDDLDFLYMDSLQTNSLQSSQWNWNKHSSFEDTCSHSWEYQTGKTTGWSLIIDNTNQARTNGLNNAISVDVEIDIRNLLPLVEIADTSRMIDDGDYYRIDLGYVYTNGVVDIDYSYWSHGTGLLTDDLDILVMESTEANKYENSNDATILGHASQLDAGGQSWSYQFPNAGTYSIIFDNTDEPNGGAGDGSDIQVEIGITSLTIPSLFGNIWTGWHQSRHYADEGDYMVLDLGNLNAGDDVYYYVDGKNIGGSIFSTEEFDILFMTKQNYDLYANGSTPTLISSGTKYKENGLIPAVTNISVSSTDHYILVLDAADGPDSYSADENGDWIWEFIVLSDAGSIVNLQATDNQYENSISVGTISAPDSDYDGVRNGIDECPATASGTNVDAIGCDNSQSDDDGDGVANDIDQCSNTPNGESTNSVGCSQSQLDDDSDGVANSLDQCPNTPATETANANGCSSSQLDSDNDGVYDSSDSCPNTPAGESVNTDGCSSSQLDSDNDGVADSLDQCPNTPAGESVDANGCSSSQLDSDGDGVSDADDACPGSDDTVDIDGDGIPDGCDNLIDSDNDGVSDVADQCENTPSSASVDENGCEIVNTTPDSDGDNVGDSIDKCDNTPANEAVNDDGCSSSQLDSDGDKVFDNVDQCLETPQGDTVGWNGCTISTIDDEQIISDDEDSSSIPGFTAFTTIISMFIAISMRKTKPE